MQIEDPRARLSELAALLRPLHRALLDESRADFERTNGPVAGPAAMFQLVTSHPHFEWLRPLSRFMAELDERIEDDEVPLGPEQAREYRDRLETMLIDENAAGGFATQYLPLLQRSTDVVVAHARVRAALKSI